ncbi:MAG: iron-sulfur cluster assembly scaffold protein [Fimbriimonadaceae bacterium]|nr:iron-sulfur cluster assembly scaffold protein [Alphaproteobacteria bacterium]
MLDDVYNKRIMALAGNIARIGRLDNPDASATAFSRLCGSKVTVDLKMEGDRIADFAHDVKACVLGQASSSLMAQHVIGKTRQDIEEIRGIVAKMLKENGPPPNGRWADFSCLEPIRDFKSRHASTLLTFDAVLNALASLEDKSSNKSG